MKELITTIIKATSSSLDDNLHKLRMNYIGNKIDTSKLAQIKFKIEETTQDGWTSWIRYINKKANRLRIEVSPNGLIGRIRYSTFLDLRNEDINAPYGWFLLESLGPRSAKLISDDLESITLISNTQIDKGLYLEDSDIASWEVPSNIEKETVMCQIAFENLQNMRYSSSLLGTELLRDIQRQDIIRCSKVQSNILLDLPFIFGRLMMKEEFNESIKLISKYGVILDANSITNIGSVLCDQFQIYEAAIKCFEKAIELDCKLQQPRLNIQVAGKRLMLDFLRKKEFTCAVDIGERVLKQVRKIQTHEFYTYLGLAYEGIGLKEEAKLNYKKALNIDSRCYVSSNRLSQLEENCNNSSNLSEILSYIYSRTEYSSLLLE